MAAIAHEVDSLRRKGFQLVFEKSAVGESESSGVAQRTVQSVEDLLRTLRGAFIGHTKTKVPMDHPAMLWLIEHTASIVNRFVVGDDGQTAYQRLHGQRATKKAVEFGEKLFYYTARKLQTKMNMRWRIGMYLGMAPQSGEHFVGTWDGDVIRTRSIV